MTNLASLEFNIRGGEWCIHFYSEKNFKMLGFCLNIVAPNLEHDKLSLLKNSNRKSLFTCGSAHNFVLQNRIKGIESCKESEISCLHLLGSFNLAYRKTFIIAVIWEDKETNDHSFDFFYYF